METDIFGKTLRGFTQRVPFQPFTVGLVNGRQLVIKDPKALVVRSGVSVYVPPSRELTIFGHEGVIRFAGAAEPKTN